MFALKPSQIEVLATWREDPAVFSRQVLGRREHTPDQERVFGSIRENPRTAVHSGHGTGKTAIAADVVLWWLATRRPAKVVTTAPTNKQVNEILWSEIRAQYARAAALLPGLPPPQRTPYLKIAPDHFGIGLSTDEPHNLSGFHSPYLLAVIDEAAGVEPIIFEQVEGVASSAGAKMFVIGNPEESSGPFYQACISRHWSSLHLSCLNHPNVLTGEDLFPGMVSRDWVDRKREEWGEESALFCARVCGEFPDAGLSSLIALSWVERAIERARPSEESSPLIACDVARFGDDETVVVALEGDELVELRTRMGQDLMKTVGMIRAFKRERGFARHTPIVIDDVGLGGGVTDRLRELGEPVVPFNGGSEPRDKNRFVNLRGEAWWKLREALREDRISLPADDQLRAQLVAPKYDFRSDGRIVLETKDDLKKRGFPSPDRADALAMAWWAQYMVSLRRPKRRKRRRRHRGGDPDFAPSSSEWSAL